MRVNVRIVIAALLAPAVATCLMCVLSFLFSGRPWAIDMFLPVLTFFYLFAFIPAIAIIFVLKRGKYTAVWQYTIGGVITAVMALSVFAMYTFDIKWFWSDILAYWPLLGVGGLTGIAMWLMVEWDPRRTAK